MNKNETRPHSTIQKSGLRAPLVPAWLVSLGSERGRRQISGETQIFRSVSVKTEFTDVYSKLDGYASNWYSEERRWIPVESLEPAQLEIRKVV